MSKKTATIIISILSVLIIGIGIMYLTNNSKHEKIISDLSQDISTRDGQIDILKAEIADKSDQIEALTVDVADKADKIEALTTDTTEKTVKSMR